MDSPENSPPLAAPRAAPPDWPVERWLASRSYSLLAVLVLFAVVVRIVYVAQFRHSPCQEWHRWPDSDMAFFVEWSEYLSAGDWLQNRPWHAYHSWHDELASKYFATVADPPVFPASVEFKRALWNRWYGEKRYHQEPLYPYGLALLMRFGSREVAVWLMYCLQLAAGVISLVLIWDITRRAWGETAALAAGVLASLSPNLLYLDLVLLRESWIVCTGLGLVWMTLWVQRRPGAFAWGSLGFFAGIVLLLKGTFLLYVGGLLVASLVGLRRDWRVLSRGFALMLGVTLGMSPALVRNVWVGAPILGTSSVAAITFINANAADSDPLGFPISWDYAAEIMAKSDGKLGPAIRMTWETHSPHSFCQFYWRKWSGLWNWFEAPDNISFPYFRLQCPVLGWLPFTFAVISPLGLAGLCCAGRRWRTLWPLGLLVANHVIALLLFTQIGRLRVPLIAALIPFAAGSVVCLARWRWQRAWLRAGGLLGGMIVLGVWTYRSSPPNFTPFRAADFAIGEELYYAPRIAALSAPISSRRGLRILEEELSREPEEVRTLRSLTQVRNPLQRDLARWFGRLHLRYAEALEQGGETEAAAAQRARAKQLGSSRQP